MSPPSRDAVEKARRFYTAVAVLQQPQGFAIALDGRIARTPAGGRLILPVQPLAAVIAEEWAAQGERLDMSLAPATRLAFTAIDGGVAARTAMAAEVARYAGSALLCYFAEGPQALVVEETASWAPLLDWAQDELGLAFVRASGIVHRPQPPETVERVQALAMELDTFSLTGLVFATGLFGSAILALAVQHARLMSDQAFDLSRLDEAFQAERWGLDAEAKARTDRLRADAQMLERWFSALAGP